MMQTIQTLRQQLTELEAEQARIRGAGKVEINAWVDSTKSRGKTYYRLRQWVGKNRPPKTIRLKDQADAAAKRAECQRGKAISKLETRKRKVIAKIDAISARAAAMGLTIPEESPDQLCG